MIRFFAIIILGIIYQCSFSQTVELGSSNVRVSWQKGEKGWVVTELSLKIADQWRGWGENSGRYTILFDSIMPTTKPSKFERIVDSAIVIFPESEFKYITKTFDRAASPVALNTAAEAISFFADECIKKEDKVIFTKNLAQGKFTTIWSTDAAYPNDIFVETTLEVTCRGYYSIASVDIADISASNLSWGVIPGYFQGRINGDFIASYAYAQGLPTRPVICRESTITLPTTILTNGEGLSLAVVVEPNQHSPRVEENNSVHDRQWSIGLSHMSRDYKITPTAYHPILAERGSFAQKGETIKFKYRFTLQNKNWYEIYKYVANDIYKFDKSLNLKSTNQSLTNRVLSMYDYLTDNKTSHWNIENYKGMEIGAQSYMGGVAGADNDAMKNSDIGAVWMLSNLLQDTILQKTRIPYVRNFKLAQQQEDGFFAGAAEGQYYLAKKSQFVEEWGSHFEPMGLTYYTLCDIGNILLFEPDDQELKEKMRHGAEKLLSWQRGDGSWRVAFDRETKKRKYDDISDLRPTFYGLYVAYRILGDERYLQGAKKGADWYIENAVKNGHFIGVCGDVRFVNDFATAQSAQALLDMFDITKEQRYKEAAIAVAKIYTTSIYTYPTPTTDKVMLNNREWSDWQLSQAGLGFEHGGIIGSAVLSGPILLAGHTGLFVRMAQTTGDKFFLDLARSAALGRDAFVNPQTHVASYYWTKFDQGAGQFPHHAWWQVGWIVDYLVAESEYRSGGKISFPRGFVTSKVGPHQTRGFDTGIIFGDRVKLTLKKDLIKIDNENIDYFTAESLTSKKQYVVLLNQQNSVNYISLKNIKNVENLTKNGNSKIEIQPFGIAVLSIK